MSRRVRFAFPFGPVAALLGAVVLASPATAGAQRGVDLRPTSATRAETDARLAAALDAETRDSLRQALLEARRHGLPTEPVVAKALEGVEKGAAGVNIQRAIRAMLGRLQTARDGLAPVASDAELVAGADALAAGVPRSALHDLRALSPRRSTATALGVLAQLVSRGVPVAKATDAVRALLQRGGGQQQLLALERTVNGDIALGLSPDLALDLRAKAIMTGLPLAAPGAASGGAVGDASALSTLNNGGVRSKP